MKEKSDTQPDRDAISLKMKKDNAQKAGLTEAEKSAYLAKRVSLGKVRAFVQKGNQGRGFKLS
mgnify:FL=1